MEGDRRAPRRREIVAVWPGLVDRAYGVAVDIGSTTIAAHLCDLVSGDTLASAGVMNPQIRFGEDLMSRVSYVMMNPGGERELTAAVREAVDGLIGAAAKTARVPRDRIVEMTAVGNPIMHHLFLGLDPTELGGAPFALTVDGALRHARPCARARHRAGREGPHAALHRRPCRRRLRRRHPRRGALRARTRSRCSSMSAPMPRSCSATGERLLACSSPTGPAFEGAQISSGQRAAPGAIERLRIDPATLEPRYKVIGSDLWSDEPGFEAAIGATGVTGICGSGIIEVIAEMFLAGIITQDGVIDGALAARTPASSRRGAPSPMSSATASRASW